MHVILIGILVSRGQIRESFKIKLPRFDVTAFKVHHLFFIKVITKVATYTTLINFTLLYRWMETQVTETLQPNLCH